MIAATTPSTMPSAIASTAMTTVLAMPLEDHRHGQEAPDIGPLDLPMRKGAHQRDKHQHDERRRQPAAPMRPGSDRQAAQVWEAVGQCRLAHCGAAFSVGSATALAARPYFVSTAL